MVNMMSIREWLKKRKTIILKEPLIKKLSGSLSSSTGEKVKITGAAGRLIFEFPPGVSEKEMKQTIIDQLVKRRTEPEIAETIANTLIEMAKEKGII